MRSAAPGDQSPLRSGLVIPVPSFLVPLAPICSTTGYGIPGPVQSLNSRGKRFFGSAIIPGRRYGIWILTR